MRLTFLAVLAVLLCWSISWTACTGDGGDTAEVVADSTVVVEPINNTLTEEERAAGWQLLFNGETTDAWKGYNQDGFPEEGWTVENGELVVLGGGGDIITKEQYADFELTLEFMLSDSANSGILYLVKELEDRPIYHSAPEYQILDDDVYASMGDSTDVHKSGANYDIEGPEESLVNPPGEWNTARIVIDDEMNISHYLNGTLVTQYQLGSPEWEEAVANSKFADWPYGQAEIGHIGLQDHGHEVRFRNIKIRLQQEEM